MKGVNSMDKWQIYEEFKKLLKQLDLAPTQYEEAIKFIANLLNI